jgi:hypothetical protein
VPPAMMNETLEQLYRRTFLRPLRTILLWFSFITFMASFAQLGLNLKSSGEQVLSALEELRYEILAEVLVGNEQTVPELLSKFSRDVPEVDRVSVTSDSPFAFAFEVPELKGKAFGVIHLEMSPKGVLLKNWLPLLLILVSAMATFFVLFSQRVASHRLRELLLDPIGQLQNVSADMKGSYEDLKFPAREYQQAFPTSTRLQVRVRQSLQ